MLEIADIHTWYGDSYVLQGVDMEVKDGTVVALLGRNGMGKTTTIRSIIGLTPTESADITERIRALGKKITVLMISHDMDLAFGVAERIILLHFGEISCEGTRDEIRADQTVKDIYMGSHKASTAGG